MRLDLTKVLINIITLYVCCVLLLELTCIFYIIISLSDLLPQNHLHGKRKVTSINTASQVKRARFRVVERGRGSCLPLVQLMYTRNL